MAKAIKWHKGVENMVSKKMAETKISGVGHLAKRAGIFGGWRGAVDAIIADKQAREDAIELLSVGMVFHVTKAELRRAAKLV